jgi:hypothetical protein
MTDESRSATVRGRPQHTYILSLAVGSCLIGLVVAIAGFLLADWQSALLQTNSRHHDHERTRLISLLEDARLRMPRLRLEELASLPLLSEFISLSETHPDAGDAQELRSYIHSMFNSAREELGLTRIVLQSVQGVNLLISEHETVSSNESSETALETVVFDFVDSITPAGMLIGYVPQVASEQRFVGDTSGARPSQGGAVAQAIDKEIMSDQDVPKATRLFAGISGLAISIIGLCCALILRRQKRYA